jgi:hypothetical protein
MLRRFARCSCGWLPTEPARYASTPTPMPPHGACITPWSFPSLVWRPSQFYAGCWSSGQSPGSDVRCAMIRKYIDWTIQYNTIQYNGCLVSPVYAVHMMNMHLQCSCLLDVGAYKCLMLPSRSKLTKEAGTEGSGTQQVVVSLQRTRTNRTDAMPSMPAHEAVRCILLGSSCPFQVRLFGFALFGGQLAIVCWDPAAPSSLA